jgi:hypothetical protein
MAKHIVEGKVKTRDHKIFTVGKAAPGEQPILLHFGRKVGYRVVKLSVKDLPAKDRAGKKIRWVNNFAVMTASGSYVKNVRYTLFLRPKKNAAFVYRDRFGLHRDKTPKYRGKKPPRTGMLQVELTTGDPAAGWT